MCTSTVALDNDPACWLFLLLHQVILPTTVGHCAVNVVRAALDTVGHALQLLITANMSKTGAGHLVLEHFTRLRDHACCQITSSAGLLLAHNMYC